MSTPSKQQPPAPKEERKGVSAALNRLKTYSRTSPMVEAIREIAEALQAEIVETRSTVGKMGFELAKTQRRIADIESLLRGDVAPEDARAAHPAGLVARVNEMLRVVYGDEIPGHILKMYPEGMAAAVTMELMETQDGLEALKGVLGKLDGRMGRHGNELTELQLILQNAFGHDFERAKAMGNDNNEWSKALLLSQLCSEYVTVESVRELAIRRGPVTIKHALEDFTKPHEVKMALESKYLQEGQWLNTGLKRRIEANSHAITQRAQYFLDHINFEKLVMEMHEKPTTI